METNTVNYDQMAENYRKVYKDQVEVLEKSILNKVEGVNEYHIVQLGKQLDSFKLYTRLLEANGSLNNLGVLPKIAFDVITATMAQSVLPVMASVQAIEAQKGIIHFKNVQAKTTKGNLTAGEVIIDPRSGAKTPSGYASNFTANEVAGTGDATEVTFNYVLASLPSRSQFLSVSAGAGVSGQDVGVKGSDNNIGSIWGSGVSGTVNYSTGAISLTFAVAPANGQDILVSYQQNYEEAQDIPRINSYWDSKEIDAQVYALKSTIGILQQFTLQKQYGESAMDEMAKDLIRAMNTEIAGDLIRKLLAQAQGATSFSKTAPTGVSFFEHKMTYMDSLYAADSTIAGNAGRGQISVMIVGREHAALVASLPGFEKLSDGRSMGPHVFGRLNGVTYIRVNEDALMGGDPKAGVGMFKGDSPFDASAVYSPFMPLTVTSDLPELPNPLVSQKAAACMAGVEVIVPQYATRFNLTA